MSSLSSSAGDYPQRILVLTLGGFLAVELGALVWLVRFDWNEGWYALYPSMVLDGQVPYRDFFYHRLPLLPFFFAPAVLLPFSMLVSVRILCAVCAWLAWWFGALTAKNWTGSRESQVWVLILGIASFYANSYLVTAQSYAPFAMFLVLAIWILSRKKVQTVLCLVVSGILLAIAMGFRFGPDPLLVIIPATFFLYRWRKAGTAKLPVITMVFIFCLAGLLVLSMSWDVKAFFWGVFVWPFKAWEYFQENGFTPGPTTFGAKLIQKVFFMLDVVESYLPVLLIILVGIIVTLQLWGIRRLSQWFQQRDQAEQLAWVLILADFGFFLAAQASGPMQYAFVLPLAAACGVSLARGGLLSMGWLRTSPSTLLVLFSSLFGIGLIGDIPPSCSRRSPGTDVVALGKLGERLRSFINPGKYVVTFDPVLVANAGGRVYPGMEFELYGFYPKWDTPRALRLKIFNWPMLKGALDAPQTGAVVLASRRWSDQNGMGKLLRPYREKFLDALQRSFHLAARYEMPACVGVGTVDVYVRSAEHQGT